MNKRLVNLLVLTTAPIVCAGFATDAAARQDGDGTPSSGILSSSRLVSDDELSQMRGGFFTAAGAQFDFGASVQTLVNGKLALLTNVQWTPAGAVTQQLQGLGSAVQAQVSNTVATGLANAGIATPGSSVQTGATGNSTPVTSLAATMPATDTANSAPTSSASATAVPATAASTTPALASAPATSAAAAPATSLATNTPAASTPAPASVPDAAAPVTALAANSPAVSSPATGTQPATVAPSANAPAAGGTAPMVLTGVQIPGADGGLTQIFANIAGGQIQNVIMNSASGQSITQNTNITMTIYNFAAWQQQVAQNMLSGRLASDMLAASGISGGH